MPIDMKVIFMEMLHDDNVKIGERQTSECYATIFNQPIDEFGC